MSKSFIPPSCSCDSRVLSSYLAGLLSQEKLGWVEDHLNQCCRCVKEIDELAANQEFWTEANRALETVRDSDAQLPPSTKTSPHV